MKILLFFMAFIISLSGFGQDFSKSDFNKTDWFVNNENGAFLNKDTLKFIKYSNRALDYKYTKYKEYELKHFGHGYFVEIDFRRGRKMNFRTRINNSITKYDFKKYEWGFDKKKSIISIYKDGVLMMKLKPIERKIIEIDSRLAKDKGLLKTTEITFIRI